MSDALEVFAPLAGLPERLREQLKGSTTVRRLAHDAVLFEQDADPHTLFVILSGRVALQRMNVRGDRRTVCLLSCPSLCCCVTALDGGPYPATATVQGAATVAGIPCGLFRELLLNQPRFAKGVLDQLGRQLRQFQCDGTPSEKVGIRIARRILSAATEFGNSVPFTRREIAEMVGTTVETAIRETRRFEEAGWISLSRGHVLVLDRDALNAEVLGGEMAPGAKAKSGALQACPARSEE